MDKEADIRRKRKAVTVCAIYLALFVFCIGIIYARGSENIYPIYLLNIGVDLTGMVVCFVLFICCLIDTGTIGSTRKYYKYLINVTFLGLMTDLVAWVVDSVPDLKTLNLIDNTLYYMCMPLGCYFFWRYTETMLKADSRLIKKIDFILCCGMTAAIVFSLINILTGMYFTISDQGVYSRSALYPVSMIYMFVVSATTIFMVYKYHKKLERYQIMVLMLYVIAPTGVGIMTMMVYGLSISYGVISIILLLMYCLINLEQSRIKAAAERDLSVAASIQQSHIPNIFPPFPGRPEIDLYAAMIPAREVGGDFYDYFFIDDDHLCVVMADVSGKGVPAALFMMISKTILQNSAKLGKSVSEVLKLTNDSLCANNKAEMFVTCWVGILELSTGRLTAANAGHEYPAIMRPGRPFEIYKDEHGFVLGGMEGMQYKEYEMMLEPGTKIFLYTDGLPEAVDNAGNMFGTERMLSALNASADKPSEKIIGDVRAVAAEFVKGEDPFDDLTMLCLHYRG